MRNDGTFNRDTRELYDCISQSHDKRMRRIKNAARLYLELPAMYRELPSLRGKDVLCLGCGTGEECCYLKAKGARRVVGIDFSRKAIQYAKAHWKQAEFHVMDITRMNFPKESFDFVYSSLTFHYIHDWTHALKKVHTVVRPGGTFLFSTHHPVRWGAEVRRGKIKQSHILGYIKYENRRRPIIYGDYLNPREINDIWFQELNMRYWHKPFSVIFRYLKESGFVIDDIIEPKPVPSAKMNDASFWEIHQKIPLFIIFVLRKK